MNNTRKSNARSTNLKTSIIKIKQSEKNMLRERWSERLTIQADPIFMDFEES